MDWSYVKVMHPMIQDKFNIYELQQYCIVNIHINLSMQPQPENIFYKFIIQADRLPPQAKIFPFFEFMDLSIRKSFNQIKKTNIKKLEGLESLQKFWNQLNGEDRVNLYCKWSTLLGQAMKLEKNPGFKFPQESVTIQDQIYMKGVNFFSKWEKKIVKLTPTHLLVKSSKHSKEYELKDYEFRNFRLQNKELQFAWILQAIHKNATTLYFSVKTQEIYNQWFYSLIYNIDNARVSYFCKCIQMERQNPGSSKELQFQQKKKTKKNNLKKSKSKKSETHIKTITQIVIDNEMKEIDEDVDDIEILDNSKKKSFLHEKSSLQSIEEENQGKENPNIFNRLMPQKQSLLNFANTPINCPLLHVTPEYKIFEIPQETNQDTNISILKMYTTLPYSKQLIFRMLTSEIQQLKWNTDCDMIHIKTRIQSENSVLFYEKSKSQGLLYRQRDFLYLRHCFSITNLKTNNTFIVDKSIDSIHLPPFMTVVRAEKQIIWGLFQNSENECSIVIQGWIKGGGYMNMIQNREMTLKFMKQILALDQYIKGLDESQKWQVMSIFKERWDITVQGEEECDDEESSQSQKQNQVDKEQDMEYRRQMQEFIEKTKEQNQSYASSQRKSELYESENKIMNNNYSPPPIHEGTGQVMLPSSYLNTQHILQPKQKSKNPIFYQHINGHHLYKGEWQLSLKGGLKYIDEEKMREQKKVLTYIIKRIGKNIFSGKGILNVSLPVDIFCIESNIQRLAQSMGFFPCYLQKAALIDSPEEQLKQIIGAGIASSLIYMTVEKPFNPILGETFQCQLDGCPLYFEQISHHPPIAAFYMVGRGYRVSGSVQAKMELSVNSGTGNNQGIFTIQFDNGNKFYFTTPSGCISGVTYGERKLNMVGKCYYWSNTGLFLEIAYNPESKKGFFSSNKGEGDEILTDYIEGFVKQFDISQLKGIAFKQEPNQLIPIIPKSTPSEEPLKKLYKVYGRWDNYVICENQKILDADQTRFYRITDYKNPLPSHSNYRQDIVYRRLRNFVMSQQFKQKLEIKQRNDRKLRAKHSKDYN